MMIEISFYGIISGKNIFILSSMNYVVGRKIFLFLLREEINSISALINLLHTQKKFWEKYLLYHKIIDFKKHGSFHGYDTFLVYISSWKHP